MTMIMRPLKEGDTHTYEAKVDAGFRTILASEADGDFDTIYADHNGHIINDNIQDGAAIAYEKLDLAGRIQPTDLIDGFTFPPGHIDTAELADGAVTSAKILDGTINAVDLAPLASLRAASPLLSITPNTLQTGSELAVITIDPRTWAGSAVLLFLAWSCRVDWQTGTTGSGMTIRLRTGTGPADPLWDPPIREVVYFGRTDGFGVVEMPFSPLQFFDLFRPGTYQYTVTYQGVDLGAGFPKLIIHGGHLNWVEFC